MPCIRSEAPIRLDTTPPSGNHQPQPPQTVVDPAEDSSSYSWSKPMTPEDVRHAMKLGHYLSQERILIDVDGDSPESVIRAISSRLGEQAGLPDREIIEEALLARERSHSTSLGGGVAVPHATLVGVDRPTLAVAVAREPIEYGGVEPGSVKVLFVLLSPPGFAGDHIKLLARVCRLVRQNAFTEALAEAATPTEVLSIIEDQEKGWA